MIKMKLILIVGLKFQNENIIDKISEWTLIDLLALPFLIRMTQ